MIDSAQVVPMTKFRKASIGAPRKAGRRRERPMLNAPLAQVLNMANGLEKREGTSAEQIRRLEITVQEMTRALATAARAAKSSRVKMYVGRGIDRHDFNTPEGKICHLEAKISAMMHCLVLAADSLEAMIAMERMR